MKLIAALLLAATFSFTKTYAQNGWTLKQCIDYAVEHNISAARASNTADQQAVSLNTAKNSRLPSLNANIGGDGSIRKGSYEKIIAADTLRGWRNVSTAGMSFGLSAGIPIFEGMRIKHEIAGNELDLKASMHDLQRAKDDVAVNITSLYLQVLFNKEMLKVARAQVEISRSQAERSRIMVEAGKNAESVLYESKALLAKDELSLTQSENTLNISILNLMQALNLDSYGGFDIEQPDAEQLLEYAMTSHSTPEEVYGYAEITRPAILAENLRLERSKTNLRLARSAYYPQISMSAGYSNGYSYSFENNAYNTSFSNQINHGGRESIGLSVSIPIFNKFATRNSVRSAELRISSQQLMIDQVKQSLRKEIEQAYYDAEAAAKKYKSADESVNAAREAFHYEQVKIEAGSSTTYEFNDAKTRLERSEADMIQAKYEFIFSRKILDFYSGIPLAM